MVNQQVREELPAIIKPVTARLFAGSDRNKIEYLRRMEELLQQIDTYKKEIENFIAENGETAESFRIKYLGTKGIVKNLMHAMKQVPNEKKKEIGQMLNELKQAAEAKLEVLKQESSAPASESLKEIDWTLPGD